MGALHACRVFGPDSRGALAHKATGFSAKLLRRGDQCRAVLACAHLFWQPLDGVEVEAAAAAPAEVRDRRCNYLHCCRVSWQRHGCCGYRALTRWPSWHRVSLQGGVPVCCSMWVGHMNRGSGGS